MTKLSAEQKQQLETPCVVADMDQVKQNIRKMQEIADCSHCQLRPHIKTHKSVEIARMQIEAGACGITCATVTEAQVMADGGIDDIFIAYPLVGMHKLLRAKELYGKVKRLLLAADSIEGARALSEYALREGLCFEVRLEIDTGAGRTGIPLSFLEEAGKAILSMQGIHVTGIYTFKSLLYQKQPTKDARLAGEEEGRMLNEAAGLLRKLGYSIQDVSAGSTPTGAACAETGLVSEIRPGTYIFYDWMTYLEGACEPEEIAAAVYATVVSTPDTSYAVVDGGAKTFSGDIRLMQPPFFYQGFAYLPDHPDLQFDRMNEEHGMLRTEQEKTGLSVGEVVRMVPVHICTAVNLQDHFYAVDRDGLRKIPVDARGKLV